MSVLIAVLAGGATFLVVAGSPRARLVDRVARYLRPPSSPVGPTIPEPGVSLRRAGLDWSPRDLAVRRLAAGGAGATVGILLAQGDLFLTGPSRSMPGLALAGAAAGVLALNMWLSTRSERRAARLRQELPTVADTIALHITAGESVASALERFCAGATGVAADELGRVVDAYREGAALTETLAAAARDTADPDAGRLYALLGHAHRTGGRLADALSSLAVDFRASLSRELTAEGGRKALTTYGPILALMIPATVLFLMYPTLVGLRQLSGGP